MHWKVSRHYQNLSKELVSVDATSSEDARSIDYKIYPRAPKIPFSSSHETTRPELVSAIRNRNSFRDFKGVDINLDQLGQLLQYSCGIRTNEVDNPKHRVQPSGGARYPIEVYPLILRSDASMAPGLYHYGVEDHTLELLWERAFSDSELDTFLTYPWSKKASVILFMTAMFSRSQSKYGERGYRYILIEAGHIGQNLMLVADALGLKTCALGGTHDTEVEKLLDIDGVSESLVYTIAVGK